MLLCRSISVISELIRPSSASTSPAKARYAQTMSVCIGSGLFSPTRTLTFVRLLDVGCVSSLPLSKSNLSPSGSLTAVSDPPYALCRSLSHFVLKSPPTKSGTFIRESYGQLYSPEVFAISQLLSEIPNSVVLHGRALGSDGSPDREWRWVRWAWWDWIPVARNYLYGTLWCDAHATHWYTCSVDPGMLSRTPCMMRFID